MSALPVGRLLLWLVLAALAAVSLGRALLSQQEVPATTSAPPTVVVHCDQTIVSQGGSQTVYQQNSAVIVQSGGSGTQSTSCENTSRQEP